jgi:hypothetical protein
VRGRKTYANVGQFTPLAEIPQGPSGNRNLPTSSSSSSSRSRHLKMHVVCLFCVISTPVLRCCHCLQGSLPRPDTRTNCCRCFLCSPLVSKHTTDKWLLNLFISQPLSVLTIRGFTKEVAFYLQFHIIGLHFVVRITKPGQWRTESQIQKCFEGVERRVHMDVL